MSYLGLLCSKLAIIHSCNVQMSNNFFLKIIMTSGSSLNCFDLNLNPNSRT